MKMIFREVFESLTRRKWFSALICIQITMLFFTSSVLFLTYTQIETKSNRLKPLNELKPYQLSDDLVPDSKMVEFFKDPGSLNRLKNFYQNLEHKLGERYIYLFDQSVEVKPGSKKEWDKKFIEGYEDGAPIHLFEGPYYPFKALQINKQGFENFSIPVSKGTPFAEKDYYYDNKGVIPVLLGAEYKPYYQIGDKITARYLFKDVKLVVKGFIQPNTLVFNSVYPELYLDRYIVMPAQQFADVPSNKEELSFQQKHYLQLVNGTIFSGDSAYVVRSKLEHIKTISDFTDTQLIGANDSSLDFVFSAIHINARLLRIIAGSLFIVSILSLSILITTKIQDNLKNMSIHLISGATMKQLFSYYLAEVIFMVGLPGLITILLYQSLINVSFGIYMLMISILIAFIVLISAVPIYLQFRKLDISRLLKRSE